MMNGLSEPISLVELARILVARLERLSVDSRWARRALGVRGNLLKALAEADLGAPPPPERLEPLVRRGFEIVEAAAREIPNDKHTA